MQGETVHCCVPLLWALAFLKYAFPNVLYLLNVVLKAAEWRVKNRICCCGNPGNTGGTSVSPAWHQRFPYLWVFWYMYDLFDAPVNYASLPRHWWVLVLKTLKPFLVHFWDAQHNFDLCAYRHGQCHSNLLLPLTEFLVATLIAAILPQPLLATVLP